MTVNGKKDINILSIPDPFVKEIRLEIWSNALFEETITSADHLLSLL